MSPICLEAERPRGRAQGGEADLMVQRLLAFSNPEGGATSGPAVGNAAYPHPGEKRTVPWACSAVQPLSNRTFHPISRPERPPEPPGASRGSLPAGAGRLARILRL